MVISNRISIILHIHVNICVSHLINDLPCFPCCLLPTVEEKEILSHPVNAWNKERASDTHLRRGFRQPRPKIYMNLSPLPKAIQISWMWICVAWEAAKRAILTHFHWCLSISSSVAQRENNLRSAFSLFGIWSCSSFWKIRRQSFPQNKAFANRQWQHQQHRGLDAIVYKLIPHHVNTWYMSQLNSNVWKKYFHSLLAKSLRISCNIWAVTDTLLLLHHKSITNWSIRLSLGHDDVIKWNIFRVIGPLCWEFTCHR